MTTPDTVRAHIEWLCDHGMTQRHIGNGVCPPQAAAALTELLAQLPAGHY